MRIFGCCAAFEGIYKKNNYENKDYTSAAYNSPE